MTHYQGPGAASSAAAEPGGSDEGDEETDAQGEWREPEAVATIPGLLADFGSDPNLRAQIQELFLPPAREQWAGLLSDAIERGEVRREASVDASFHALNGAVFSRIVLGGEEADERFADELGQLVLSGLSPSEPAG